MADKKKLKCGNWDPIFKSNFGDLRKMPKTAFILRLLYRSYRNPRTNICDLPDVKVREITGWDRQAVQFAREFLLKKRLIISRGYHLYFVPKLSTNCRKIRQPHLTENPATVAGKPCNRLTENPATVAGKPCNFPHPTDTDIYTDNNRRVVASLSYLTELHIQTTGATNNNGLRQAVSKHLEACFLSGWSRAEMEAKIKANTAKKTIYEVIKPQSEQDRRIYATSAHNQKLQDLKKKGFICSNCNNWDKDRPACKISNDYAFWYQICKYPDKFKPKEEIKCQPST